ncbi:MAG: nucleoside triphosphate pyrophosphohydrolase [Anaerolineae bacterium]|nr:nucleoside triphosphate pyrophosphohydrolase [Anaerolineae bacterium]
MPKITIVGLGPGAPEHLTREAWSVLTDAHEVWLRTTHHPVVAGFPTGLTLHSFDSLYEAAESFEQVYTTIVERILDLGRLAEGVIYAVPGHPLVGEATVPRILKLAKATHIPVRVVAGLSFVEPLLTALELDALDGLQIFDALDIMQLEYPPLNPDFPALIAQVYNRNVASNLKLVLMNQYPDDHEVTLISGAGTQAQKVQYMPLYAVDRQDSDPLTSLYLAPLAPVSSFEGFQQTIARLRAPGGCPWDQKQTHESLCSNLLEETYEVLAAIDIGDIDALCEELGDLLLQIVLHAQIAIEEGEFQMPDIISGIDTKIKRRHPHVWGDTQVGDAEEVSVNWEAIKRAERESNGQATRSLLDGVPGALPALAQSQAYSSRAARVGFEWPDIANTVAKVYEELKEIEAAEDVSALKWELGDLLFAIANWARWLEIDLESALREANLRFAERFKYIERQTRERNLALQEIPLPELLRLWDEAKTIQK